MISTEVRVGEYSHSVLIGAGLLANAGELIRQKLPPSRCAIVSDTNVAPLFSETVRKSLAAAGFEPTLITISAGEQSKTLEQAGKICDEMLEAGLDRQSFVIGVGGGVIGDVSGFVSAIFERGVPHLQIPTTLLAMVDSSIGGKTGVNTQAGKNLIGAVHQPALVIDDVDVLKTLPPRELNQGFAEVIKHAIIAEAEMFNQLREFTSPQLDRLKRSSLEALVERNVKIKARIIENDERDRVGQRALLNFGHTVGHGIERADDFRNFLHGEAISLGIVAAAAISNKKAGLPAGAQQAIIDLLKSFNLPVRLPADFPRQKILDALKFDKKFEHGQIRFVLISKIGSAFLSRDVTMEDICAAVEKL